MRMNNANNNNNIISPFYKQILKSYFSEKCLDETPCSTIKDFLNQPLWGNNMFIIRIRKSNQPMYLLTGSKVVFYM